MEGDGVQDFCTNNTDPPLSSTVRSVGQREQPEVKCFRETYNVVMMQGDIYIVYNFTNTLSQMTDNVGWVFVVEVYCM